MSKMWVNDAINLFSYQHKLPEIVEVVTLCVLCSLSNDGKQNDD